MILIMLMPRIFLGVRSSAVTQTEYEHLRADQGLGKRAASMISIAKEA